MAMYNIMLMAMALTLSPTLILAKEIVDVPIPSFQSPSDPDENTNRYIVKFKAGSTEFQTRMQHAARRHLTQNLRRNTGADSPDDDNYDDTGLLAYGSFLPKDNAEVLYLNSEKEVRGWEERDDVEYVELDSKIYLLADNAEDTELTPYGISKVHALDVDDTYVSDRKVCVIDTGFDRGHPDLVSDPNILTGYSGPFSKYTGDWYYDGHGHGTHVTGTIAAIGGNGIGVKGVTRNGQLKLHIVKVFHNKGYWAWSSTLLAAVEECVDSGSNVVNMSLGGARFSQVTNDGFERIVNEDNVLLVAAAGNSGATGHFYPASYPSVLSVAATDKNNEVTSFSQKNNQIDIAAPGLYVESTLPRHKQWPPYGVKSGTSMAAPHVAGVAALIWSLDTSKSAIEIRGVLEATAEDIDIEGHDISSGHGLIRADRARDALSTFTLSPTTSPTRERICKDEPHKWYDIDGYEYNCRWYAVGSNCEDYGDDYENFGKTANEACCVCGGGDRETYAPTVSPTEAEVVACPEGQVLLQVKVVTDANGANENQFVVKMRNSLNKFQDRVWFENDFQDNTTETFEKCLPVDGCYKFLMIDKGNDGMCCDEGDGGLRVTWDGSVIVDTLDSLSFDSGGRIKSDAFGTC